MILICVDGSADGITRYLFITRNSYFQIKHQAHAQQTLQFNQGLKMFNSLLVGERPVLHIHSKPRLQFHSKTSFLRLFCSFPHFILSIYCDFKLGKEIKVSKYHAGNYWTGTPPPGTRICHRLTLPVQSFGLFLLSLED